MQVYSIFNSVDGECNLWGQGTFSTFVRFSGCNLFPDNVCDYCDTKYALSPDSGQDMSLNDVYKAIDFFGCKKVTITGGEPLLQEKSVLTLLDVLFTKKYKVSVETNGTIPVPVIFRWNKDLCWIVDYKLDHEIKMNTYAFCNLGRNDFVKILVKNEKDIFRAKEVKDQLTVNGCQARFFLSPVHGKISPATIVETVQKYKLFDFSLNVQIHKLLGLE